MNYDFWCYVRENPWIQFRYSLGEVQLRLDILKVDEKVWLDFYLLTNNWLNTAYLNTVMQIDR
jgi:hypothetical protein